MESKPDKYKELKKWTRKIIGFAEVPLYYISNPEEFSRDLELAEFKRENYTVRKYRAIYEFTDFKYFYY